MEPQQNGRGNDKGIDEHCDEEDEGDEEQEEAEDQAHYLEAEKKELVRQEKETSCLLPHQPSLTVATNTATLSLYIGPCEVATSQK